jgi:hypothetical protein
VRHERLLLMVTLPVLGLLVGCGADDAPFTNDRSDPLSVSALCADVAAYEDGRFWVLGRLDASKLRCTAASCGLGVCCNYCEAPYVLACVPPLRMRMRPGVDGSTARTGGHPGGNSYPGVTWDGCAGDDCGPHECSHLPPGGDVLLHGHLAVGPVQVNWGAGGVDLDRQLVVDVVEEVTAPPAFDRWDP